MTELQYSQPGSTGKGILWWLCGTFSMGWFLNTILSDSSLAGMLMNRDSWRTLVSTLTSDFHLEPAGFWTAKLGPQIFVLTAVCSLSALAIGSWLRARRTLFVFRESLGVTGRAWKWWLFPALWELLRVVSVLAHVPRLEEILITMLPFWLAVSVGGWLGGLFLCEIKPPLPDLKLPRAGLPKTVFAGMVVFAAVFFTLNWRLYQGLLIPHGDSAMYEEHLWNLTHGKGFRSYLDQGLFLGEHIQVIHVLLLPFHAIWPSHLLLELSEAIALASCAWPVARMALRETGNKKAAALLGLTALVYFPLHFLEISIDLKTFRPISFGVPLMLWTLERVEAKDFKRAFFCLAPLTLMAKEDFAVVLAPLGIWIAWRAWTQERNRSDVRKGILFSALVALYLVLVVKVLIPWFRAGDDVHYARYFGSLGSTPGDIVRSIYRQPIDVFNRLYSERTLLYGLMLLVPLGGLPLLSPSRLCVGLPLFGVLSLMQLSAQTGTVATDMLIPFHHFHAPLVPILFWAASVGLGNTLRFAHVSPERKAAFALGTGLACAALFSISPLGIKFWDPHSEFYWKSLYVPDRRAELFPRVLSQIPESARVASTDFVHPRFTHYERSYDYSQYARKVSGYELRVPDDTDFIVIDTRHRYSWIDSPDEVPELRDQPDRWELLPDHTEGYFIVLKRKPVAESERESSLPEGTAP